MFLNPNTFFQFELDHIFHTGTIKTVPQKKIVPIFTQELFRVTIYGRVTFLHIFSAYFHTGTIKTVPQKFKNCL